MTQSGSPADMAVDEKREVAEAKVRDAEKRIQKILTELCDDANCEIEDVDVDTRNFANLAVSIFVTERA